METTLTPRAAARLLRGAGIDLRDDEPTVEQRDDRFLVRLDDARLAWFPATENGRLHLQRERRVLGLLAQRCTFGVPRLLYVDAQGRFDVRRAVPHSRDPLPILARVERDARVAARLGESLGGILAQQHLRIRADDVRPWLPQAPDWPRPRAWCRKRIARVCPDLELARDSDRVLAMHEELCAAESDRVLVHTDVGFHNMGIDDTDRVIGLFDYGDACWSDRHLDFRYLTFGRDAFELLDAAAEAYVRAGGKAVHRDRVLLCNAAAAVGFLAWRDGVGPEVRWCGRTLAEDLRWSRLSIDRALSSPT